MFKLIIGKEYDYINEICLDMQDILENNGYKIKKFVYTKLNDNGISFIKFILKNKKELNYEIKIKDNGIYKLLSIC